MKISNPLTIIAVFAGVAEALATVSLINLSPDIQKIFVYFVMFFPTLIVLLFFLVLFFKNQVLYAPSDFKDENNYLTVHEKTKKPLNIDEAEKKVEEKLNEAKNLEEQIHQKVIEIIKKAKIDEKEQNEFFERYKHNFERILQAKNEAKNIQNEISLETISRKYGFTDINYLYENMNLANYTNSQYTSEEIQNIYQKEIQNVHPFVSCQFQTLSLINESEKLTEQGIKFINDLVSIKKNIGAGLEL